MIGRDYEARIKTKTAQLHAIWVSIHSGYEESKVGLTHTQEAEVQAAPLQSELRHSLENKDLTDYEVADFILRKLATLEALPRRKKLQLVDVVLENVDECVLCELCLDAAPDGTVTVKKLYDGTELKR